jgi:tripartite-type tricarboxylate transporter receptor subunit TctC
LNAEVRTALKRPEVAGRVAGLGVEAVGNTPEELAEFLREEITRWAQVIRKAGLKME